MKIYVLRHGQTNWNVNKRIQGKQDIELNEIGIKQAYEAKEKFNLLNIDLIMCSPLKRTKKTAEIINQDKNVHIIYKKELIERDLGEFEGKNCKTEKGDIYNYYANISAIKDKEEGSIFSGVILGSILGVLILGYIVLHIDNYIVFMNNHQKKKIKLVLEK